MRYSFIIDEKSLFRGVKNDHKKGQSATVHTPLNQSQDKNKWHNDIYDFINGCESEDKVDCLPEFLKAKCLKKTTSKASTKVVHFYTFSKFSLDGASFDVDYSFAMYVKEETDTEIVKRDGKKTENTHLGRQTLHYPISFNYESIDYSINNEKILDTILKINGGFAYVVNGFDFDTNTQILNFRTTMIGPKGILLSTVFKRKKGVGVKLLVDRITLSGHDMDDFSRILTPEEKSAFYNTLEKIEVSRRRNGMMGEEFVFNNISRFIGVEPDEKRHVSKVYPQSPYDIECKVSGKTTYIEVKSTQENKKVFFMSKGERKFMDKYSEHYILVLVTNVDSDYKTANTYHRDDILNPKIMEAECDNIKYMVK